MKPSNKEVDIFLEKLSNMFHDLYDAGVGAPGNDDKALTGFQDKRLLF